MKWLLKHGLAKGLKLKILKQELAVGIKALEKGAYSTRTVDERS